jgi:hypothetical protein
MSVNSQDEEERLIAAVNEEHDFNEANNSWLSTAVLKY